MIEQMQKVMTNDGEQKLAECLKAKLNQHFKKLGEQLQLCICERREEKNAWEILSGDSEICCALEKMILNYCDRVDWLLQSERALDDSSYVIVFSESKHIRDSRPGGGGKIREVWFVFCARQMTESFRLIASVCSHEIFSRLRDLLYLEYLAESDVESPYLLGNLKERDWIVREYVKCVLREYKLPKRNVFVQISGMLYEKRSVDTCMYFAEEIEKMIDMDRNTISLMDEYKLSEENLRSVRKLMELAGSGHGLKISRNGDDFYIKGVVKDADCLQKGVFVKFENHMIWKLNKGRETVFEYSKGLYKLPELEPKDNIEIQLKDIDELILEKEQKENMKSVIRCVARKACHGTSIVFMDEKTLKEQVDVLSEYGRVYRVQPFNLRDQLADFEGVLAIDGALFADENCKCCAVGVIVAGKLVKKGTIGRGARYNSLVNYVHAVSETMRGGGLCCAAIISEDETVDIVIPQMIKEACI